MAGTMQVRTADRCDIAALLDLYRHLHPGDPELDPGRAAEIFARLQAYPGSAIFLGACGERLVASCTLVVIPNLTRGGLPYGLIENVVTHGEFRQRGFGKALLDAASGAAWQAGCYKLMLLTGTQDPGVLAFYRAAGFAASKTGFQKRRGPA